MKVLGNENKKGKILRYLFPAYMITAHNAKVQEEKKMAHLVYI